MNAISHFSVCKIYRPRIGWDVRLKFSIILTQLPFLGVLIPYIISIIRICIGAKLHNTVSHNDRSRYTRTDPFCERFSNTGTTFSLAAYYKHNHSPVFRVSRRKGEKREEKRRLLNKPRRSISGIAAPWVASLPLIWTFRKRYWCEYGIQHAGCYTQIRVYSQSRFSPSPWIFITGN